MNRGSGKEQGLKFIAEKFKGKDKNEGKSEIVRPHLLEEIASKSLVLADKSPKIKFQGPK